MEKSVAIIIPLVFIYLFDFNISDSVDIYQKLINNDLENTESVQLHNDYFNDVAELASFFKIHDLSVIGDYELVLSYPMLFPQQYLCKIWHPPKSNS